MKTATTTTVSDLYAEIHTDPRTRYENVTEKRNQILDDVKLMKSRLKSTPKQMINNFLASLGNHQIFKGDQGRSVFNQIKAVVHGQNGGVWRSHTRKHCRRA